MRSRLVTILVQGEQGWGPRAASDEPCTTQHRGWDEADPDFRVSEFFRTPDHCGVASVSWQIPSLIDLWLGARYTGEMQVPHYAGFIPEDRLETSDEFFTVDLRLAAVRPADLGFGAPARRPPPRRGERAPGTWSATRRVAARILLREGCNVLEEPR